MDRRETSSECSRQWYTCHCYIFILWSERQVQKLNYLYDLQDAACDSRIIKEYSQNKGHRPIIDINPKNSKILRSQIELAKSEKEILQAFNLYNDWYEKCYNQRSSAKRVNAYLKDNFGCDKVYYRGAVKVASVLAFGVLSVCIHQSLKLVIWLFKTVTKKVAKVDFKPWCML